MFLKYTTREGNFNFARPSEVSYSCHIAICDDDANKIKTCNFEPTFDLNGSDVDEIDYELEESIGRYWSTSDDRKEMLEFLRANKAEMPSLSEHNARCTGQGTTDACECGANSYNYALDDITKALDKMFKESEE